MEGLEPTYLVYRGGERFASALAHGLNQALETAAKIMFGKIPEADEDEFDEWVIMRNDFNNKSFWREGDNVWESDFETGFVVVVRVETLLN